MRSNFICQIQLAKHEAGDHDEHGSIDIEGFVTEFRNIDWEFEADRLAFLGKAWPGIRITNSANGAKLWFVAYRPTPPDFLDAEEFKHNMEIWYIVRLDDPRNPPGVVSFDNGKRLSACYFETYLPGEIEELYEFFFKDGYEALFETLYSMRVAQMKRLDLSNLFFAK